MKKKNGTHTLLTIAILVLFFANSLRLQDEVSFLKSQNRELQAQIQIMVANHNKAISNYEYEIEGYLSEINRLELLVEEKKEEQPTVSRSSVDRGVFTVTCYDLSKQSTGKVDGDKGYGITKTGFDLRGHTWETAKTIAVDPKVIPLGSKVKLTFTNSKYSKYDGVYVARDIGGAIKSNKIDFFLGDFNQVEAHQACFDFGKTYARIEIIRD